MKTICLAILIAVFLLLCTNGIQAQITQNELNQYELMGLFTGTWKTYTSGNTAIFFPFFICLVNPALNEFPDFMLFDRMRRNSH